ncbi:hypothetical protein EW146_g664 [Bondarzewia mesenterica]|uniref:DUF6534 domain-containing protein n=1 Tax=Bondarzewia mesenterica TaxID=1095465 RepID=A0A4S4M655_9AGAM|nr:hypothetical protein EW146_g664 [Bondarzewia mesenterica]
MVQIYFTTIIFKLCRKTVRWWLAGTIVILTATHLPFISAAFGLVTAIPMFTKNALADLEKNIFIEVLPYSISQVLADITVAVPLTNELLNTLTVYAINRCLLTSAVALVAAIAVIVKPESFWVIAIEFIMGKCKPRPLFRKIGIHTEYARSPSLSISVYMNSLLATLNARNGLRGGSSSHGSSSISGVNSVQLSNIRLPADVHVVGGGRRLPNVSFENKASAESSSIIDIKAKVAGARSNRSDPDRIGIAV